MSTSKASLRRLLRSPHGKLRSAARFEPRAPRHGAVHRRTATADHGLRESCDDDVSVSEGAGRINAMEHCSPVIPKDLRYDPVKNPKGARCTVYDHVVNVYGRDPLTGVARRPLDNDGNMVAARTVAEPAAIRAAYRSRLLLNGGGGLATTPIIDYRDQWLTKLTEDTSNGPKIVQLRRAKPADLVDACWTRDDKPQKIVEKATYGSGRCEEGWPPAKSWQIVAYLTMRERLGYRYHVQH